MTEDKLAGWHHQLNGHEFEQAQGYSKEREDWRATFMGSQEIGHNLATEQQQYLHWRMLNLEIYSQSKTLC